MDSKAPATSGSPAKLQIKAFLDVNFSKPWKGGDNPISVGINPASYSQSMSIMYTPDKAAGEKAQEPIFNKPGETNLKLELILDGTGAVPGASVKSVDEQIFDLRKLMMQIDGPSPHYLKLLWGTLMFKGRAQSLEINCTLFNPDGTPLRAKVGANFIGINTNKTGQKSSATAPAPSNVKVMAGDTLPAMCDRLYGDSKYYLLVAQVNDLTTFRNLKPGQTLVFPTPSQLKAAGIEP
jgi:nucleoid-associated protein YgaU